MWKEVPELRRHAATRISCPRAKRRRSSGRLGFRKVTKPSENFAAALDDCEPEAAR